MYRTITGIDAYTEPMRIYPAAHFSMGGLWVDYNLMTTIPGLFALGECNFADHGANRLGANSLLQASVDGYFVIPYTLTDYLAPEVGAAPVPVDAPEFEQAERSVRGQVERLLGCQGSRPADVFHRHLGEVLWNSCGMTRNAAGLQTAIDSLRELRAEFWRDVRVTGESGRLNPELEKAGRVADYFELGELMCRDALQRSESCGAHFREEYQTPDGEARRNDDDFVYVSCWEHTGADQQPVLHREALEFAHARPTQRSYR